MKVSELINELNRFLKENGDLDVISHDFSEEANAFVNLVEFEKDPSAKRYCKGDSVTSDPSCVLCCYNCILLTLKERLKTISNINEDIECDIYFSFKDETKNYETKCKLKDLMGTKYEDYLTKWFDFNNNVISTWLIEK